MGYFINCEEDYDIDPPEANEDWVHVDNLPDFDEVRSKISILVKMVEENGTKEDILLCIDEISGMLND